MAGIIRPANNPGLAAQAQAGQAQRQASEAQAQASKAQAQLKAAQRQATQAQNMAAIQEAQAQAQAQAVKSAERLNPELAKLEWIKALIADKPSDALTHLSEDEIVEFSILKGLDSHLRTPSGQGGIPGAIVVIDQFKSMRRSKDRLGIQDIVSILKQKPYYQPMYTGAGEDEAKQGFLAKLLGRK